MAVSGQPVRYDARVDHFRMAEPSGTFVYAAISEDLLGNRGGKVNKSPLHQHRADCADRVLRRQRDVQFKSSSNQFLA
jgi:hypothetical protein